MKRGDIYFLRYDRSYGHEIATNKRPAVIISSQKGIDTASVVQVAFMSTKAREMATNIPVEGADGVRSCVVCNQILTVDKNRILHYSRTLSDEEMARVDEGLRLALDLSAMPDDYEQVVREREEYRELSEKKINELNRLKSEKSNDLDLRLELDMYKQLYAKTLDKLVELRIEIDSQSKVEEPKSGIVCLSEPEITQEEPIMEVVDDIPEEEEVFEPYIFEEEKPNVKAEFVLEKQPKKKYPKKKKTVDVPEKETKKVNINTASVKDLVNNGMNAHYAQKIIKFRKEVGGFDSVEDISLIDGIGELFLKRHAHKLTVVGESTAVEAQYVVNINTGSWTEFKKAGIANNYAQKIINFRRSNGYFASVDDLIRADGIGATFIENNRHKMTV